jgi:hypothetical protein
METEIDEWFGVLRVAIPVSAILGQQLGAVLSVFEFWYRNSCGLVWCRLSFVGVWSLCFGIQKGAVGYVEKFKGLLFGIQSSFQLIVSVSCGRMLFYRKAYKKKSI